MKKRIWVFLLPILTLGWTASPVLAANEKQAQEAPAEAGFRAKKKSPVSWMKALWQREEAVESEDQEVARRRRVMREIIGTTPEE